MGNKQWTNTWTDSLVSNLCREWKIKMIWWRRGGWGRMECDDFGVRKGITKESFRWEAPDPGKKKRTWCLQGHGPPYLAVRQRALISPRPWGTSPSVYGNQCGVDLGCPMRWLLATGDSWALNVARNHRPKMFYKCVKYTGFQNNAEKKKKKNKTFPLFFYIDYTMNWYYLTSWLYKICDWNKFYFFNATARRLKFPH